MPSAPAVYPFCSSCDTPVVGPDGLTRLVVGSGPLREHGLSEFLLCEDCVRKLAIFLKSGLSRMRSSRAS